MSVPSAASEPLQRTPLFEACRKAGGRMVPFAGWEMAVQFIGLLQEHKAVREHCGLFDISHMGVLRLTAPCVKDLFQKLVPSDLFRIGPGEACYTVLLNEQGGIRDDLIVYDRGWDEATEAHTLLLVINAACAEADATWIRRQLEPVGVQVSDHKRGGVLLSLQGPESTDQLEAICRQSISDLPRFGHQDLDIPNVGRAFLARTGYTGEDGFELLLNQEAGLALWRQCLERGIQPCGLGARDTLRLEAGMLLYGEDMDETTNPMEVGLGWVVNLEIQQEFTGRNTLEKLTSGGTSRKMVGISMTDRAIPRRGSDIYVEKESGAMEKIGKITSGGWSPTLERGIGFGLIETDNKIVDIMVNIRGTMKKGSITRKRFYSRKDPK